MRQILMLMCGMVMLSSVAFAEDTTETCADGAGVVVTGAVSGHKYCRSKQSMNWWNAYAWCDALGRRLADRSDCACGNTISDCANNQCPELSGVGNFWAWTGTPSKTGESYYVYPPENGAFHSLHNGWGGNGPSALCY